MGRQMTLGELIAQLEQLPVSTRVQKLDRPTSYRGYHDQLALVQKEGTITAGHLLLRCKVVLDKEFIGYKGGRYLATKDTPIWIVQASDLTGAPLINIHPDFEVGEEE